MRKVDDLGLGNKAFTAIEACTGAPSTIRPGAVVRMATALERVANMNAAAGEIGEGMLSTIVADAKDALAAYYGENGND